MDDQQRLNAWLRQGSQAENPLKEVQEELELRESIEALLRQQLSNKRVVDLIRNGPCTCGTVYPSGAIIVKCPASETHKRQKGVT